MAMNMTLLRVLALVTLSMMQREASKPVRVTAPGYDGAIISADAQIQSDPRHLLTANQVWTPTEADVREAEKLLAEYVNSRDAEIRLRGTRIRAELARYKRQYWGVIRGGRRSMLISFYHEDTAAAQKELWLRRIISVMGGGDQFFRVTYHMQERRFDSLQANASE